jgi:hypothetical protein
MTTMARWFRESLTIYTTDITFTRFNGTSDQTTELSVEFIKGCFMGTWKIKAFGGEIEIWIHVTTGHAINWSVNIMACDSPIDTIKSMSDNATVEDAIDAIDSCERHKHWWSAARGPIKELLANHCKGIWHV